MIGKDCENPYFSFLIVSVFQEGLYIVTNLRLLVVEKTHLSLLACFNFCFLCWDLLKDSHVSLPYFLSICAIASLIKCFDLKFRNMFSKITTSLWYNSISVFIMVLQIYFLFNFLSVFCNLISVKILMIPCSQILA